MNYSGMGMGVEFDADHAEDDGMTDCFLKIMPKLIIISVKFDTIYYYYVEFGSNSRTAESRCTLRFTNLLLLC